MPANLPPPYFEAERQYREAKTDEARLEALEEMLTLMPKHKGTDKLRADLRRRIAKLKDQSQQKKGTSRRETAYSIEKEGVAQVLLVGAPNVGKSSLVAALTHAQPEVADFPHSTWKPTPGMAPFENIQFQLVDTPPISRAYMDPWMTDLMRRAEILAVVVDLKADPLQQLEDTLSILNALRIFPPGARLPADLRKTPFIKKILVLVNKVDEKNDEEDYKAFLDLSATTLPCLDISTRSGHHLAEFLKELYKLSGVLRVYTKAPGKEPDRASPFVLPVGSTLEELASRIHKDFVNRLKFAKIWGKAVFSGQMAQRDYVLQDGDIIELHL